MRTGGVFTSPAKPSSKQGKRPKYVDEEEEDFMAHRPKVSSSLKTSSTVLDDDEDLDTPKEVIQITDEDESNTEDDIVYTRSSREIGVGSMMDDSSVFLDAPRHVGSVGSPGVPGRPILHTTRPSPQHGHGSKMRKAKSGDGVRQIVFGKNSHLVDTATQTANNASTQTSDTELGSDVLMRSSSPDYPNPVLLVNSHSIDPRSERSHRNYDHDASHRRSVSWDPPSLVQALGGDAKNPKSIIMLSQILKEKRDQLLQREMEIKERQQEQRQQQQEQQQRQHQEQLRIQEQQRVQEQQQREAQRQDQLRIQEQQRLQDQMMRDQMPRSNSNNHPHRRRESTTALSKLMPMPSPSSGHPSSGHHMPTSPSPHTQALHVSAHHHRSKSDPNVIPILLRGLHSPQRSPVGTGFGSSPQLVSALAALNAAAAAQGIPPPNSSSLRTKSQQENSPRTNSSLSARKSVNTSSTPSSPITDKQKELLELEKRIEAKQKQLQDRGYSVAPFVPREERRRDWSSILEVKDDALLSSLEDIEEEIEQIKQRTMDIQGKVQLLERCVAPDPLTMMFGDHGPRRSTKRISPYKPSSPTYVIDPPSSFASPHTESPYKRMHKHRSTSPPSYDYTIPIAPFPSSSSSASSYYPPPPVRPTMSRSSAYPSAPSPVPVKYTAPSPIPSISMGPDMSKRMNLGARASAFSPPPTQQEDPSAWTHSARSAFSPPPRLNSQEDMQIHWTRL